MMMLSEIAKAVGGQLIGADILCESVGTDSRNMVKNQLFVALKGESFDGNSYAQEAIKLGAAAVLVSDANTQARPAVVVQDTRHALGALAKYWREKFKIPLVAVTGSNGKTTVKEMITAILMQTKKSVLATQGNLNNDIGLPLTLLKLRKQHEFAVIEMGMNHLGEIDYLTRIAKPTVAVITNAGTAHIGEVGSRENIAKAKGEIFAGLDESGIAVINTDDMYGDYWKSLNDNRHVNTFGFNFANDVSASFEEKDNANEVHLNTREGSIDFKLNMLGKHNVANALAASAVAVALGISNAKIAGGLSHFGGVKGRLQRKNGLNGAALIDDTYNANPDSMKAAIDVLTNQVGKQIFVMGDMAELGTDSAQMHAEIGAYAKQKGVNILLTLGEQCVHTARAFGENATHYASLQALLTAAAGLMKKDATVLIKGSRFMQMERVVAALEEKHTEKQMMQKMVGEK